MGWSTIRRATDDDHARLDAAAERFIKRHAINGPWPFGAVNTVDDYLENACRGDAPDCGSAGVYLRHLWLACVRRALREPGAEGIAWGYIGHYAS